MINIDTIEQEILDLEKRDTTYATIERLAWLYIVRDNLNGPVKTTGDLRGGGFRAACSNVSIDALLEVLEEHFDAVRVLYPKEYDLVIEKIKSLR